MSGNQSSNPEILKVQIWEPALVWFNQAFNQLTISLGGVIVSQCQNPVRHMTVYKLPVRFMYKAFQPPEPDPMRRIASHQLTVKIPKMPAITVMLLYKNV